MNDNNAVFHNFQSPFIIFSNVLHLPAEIPRNVHDFIPISTISLHDHDFIQRLCCAMIVEWTVPFDCFAQGVSLRPPSPLLLWSSSCPMALFRTLIVVTSHGSSFCYVVVDIIVGIVQRSFHPPIDMDRVILSCGLDLHFFILSMLLYHPCFFRSLGSNNFIIVALVAIV